MIRKLPVLALLKRKVHIYVSEIECDSGSGFPSVDTSEIGTGKNRNI